MPTNLYRRNGTWYARVQTHGIDHRRSLRTRDRSEALRRLRRFIDAADHARYHGEPRHGWKEAVARYVAEVLPGTVAPATAKRYRCSLWQVSPVLAETFVDAIGRREIARIAHRKGVSNATRRRDLTAVSRVLAACVAWGWRDDNPARAYDRSLIRERRDALVLPSEADIAAVVALAPGNLARLIRLAQYTGMRQEEVAGLERGQLRGDALDVWRAKSGRPRVVPLDERAAGTIAGTPVALHSRFVFHHAGGRYRNVASRFRALVRRAAAGATAAKRPFRPFRFHDLRHWYAVDYLRRGGNIYDLAAILGHASVKTTEIYLAHLDVAEQRQAKYGPQGIGNP